MRRLAIRLWRVFAKRLSGLGRLRVIDRDTVILVHGLGRTPASMVVLRTRLGNAGFHVVNFGYPSTSEEIEVLVDRLEGAVATCRRDTGGVLHFVTHSMGGVLVRSYFERESAEVGGRVVMLSPPSQGSEIIDAFADSRLLRAVLGPAGARLGTDSDGIAQELGGINFSLGIIAGDRSINPIGRWVFSGPNDGKVSVARAQVDGAADFLVLPATHTFIMNRGDVAEQVVHFLKRGAFRKDVAAGGTSQDQI
jgi:pimeloyl-ACP methyl ester carboxylesterase